MTARCRDCRRYSQMDVRDRAPVDRGFCGGTADIVSGSLPRECDRFEPFVKRAVDRGRGRTCRLVECEAEPGRFRWVPSQQVYECSECGFVYEGIPAGLRYCMGCGSKVVEL